MLSAIVLCEENPDRAIRLDLLEALARTLGSLIRANVEGLLRDVVIAGPEGQGLERLADDAGCGLILAGSEPDWLYLAIAAARGPDILLLRSGRAPEAGFIEETSDFLRGGGATAKLRAVPEKFSERLFPGLAPLAGLIAPRDLCLEAPRGRFDPLARRFGKATIFRTRARRVG